MYERNFSPKGIILFLVVALVGLAIVRSDDVGNLWARAVEIGDRAIHEVRHKAFDAEDKVRYTVRQSDDAVNQRISELRNGDASERRYAAWALGELESDRGVDPLIGALADRDADVRLVCTWALGEIKDYAAIEPLIELLDDDDPLVREMAVLSLGEIERSTAIDPILGAVERYPELAEPAIWALGEISGRRALEARDELSKQTGQRGRDNDEVWVGRLGTREARSMSGDASALIAALGDSDAEMRASAAEWLGKADNERSVEALLDALRDPDPAVRAMAIWALDETNPSREHSQTHSRQAARSRRFRA
jgi:HEAT repeat protein